MANTENPSPRKLTVRQQEVLSTISQLVNRGPEEPSDPLRDNMVFPTIREIAGAIGVRQSTTYGHIKALANKGMLQLPGSTGQRIEPGEGLLQTREVPVLNSAYDLLDFGDQTDQEISQMPISIFTNNPRDGLNLHCIIPLDCEVIFPKSLDLSNKDCAVVALGSKRYRNRLMALKPNPGIYPDDLKVVFISFEAADDLNPDSNNVFAPYEGVWRALPMSMFTVLGTVVSIFKHSSSIGRSIARSIEHGEDLESI